MACACREAEWLRRFAEMEEKLAAAERERDEARTERDKAVARGAGRPTWDDYQRACDETKAALLSAEGERVFRRRAESHLAAASEVLREIAKEQCEPDWHRGPWGICAGCRARAFLAQHGWEVAR